MTLDEQPEHAPFSPPPSQPSPAIMPTGSTWIMDETTRNKFLKNYKTQVASATSTICATLAVVRQESEQMIERRITNQCY
jgi:hypothetical protein